ncbi:hypothetical protein H6P81_005232 [Aristolochia fimbriata]|uniref:Polymerase nucleotidyl transferase domain-containing protein n=1 Tax=Aristolochia fimbriata TaxID=158543 RepID=A0AAV7EYC6_ARIFI|nr:hypothetical protein H6P81_005232 [Aristolochia fimbriata]
MKTRTRGTRGKDENSLMDSHQLVDALAAHISLYNSSIPSSSSSSSPSTNPRNSILRWFSSLSVPQRQAALTIVDTKFLQVVLQMINRLRVSGHGFFIILPDLPSGSLPTICFRRSRGLLTRSSASDESSQRISDSLRLFSSNEGTDVSEKSCSLDEIDACTVSEEFVGDLDRFVAVMDGVSNGNFLRGEDKDLGSAWLEFPWLKAKGYYSAEAFVANRLEQALRLSWINCNGPKKRGPKTKEKAAGAAGVAANAFWRKKGCLDWWSALDPGVRNTIFRAFLGKAAKSLAFKIVSGANDVFRDEMWSFDSGRNRRLRYVPSALQERCHVDFALSTIPASVSGRRHQLANALGSVLVLRKISAMVSNCCLSNSENEKLFFSTLCSVCTVSDYILRRLRGVLMMVSSKYLQLDLLRDENSNAPVNKSLGKGKNKGQNMKKHTTVPKSVRPEKPPMVNGCQSGNQVKNRSACQPLPMDAINVPVNGKKDGDEPISMSGGCSVGVGGGKTRVAVKKSGRSNSRRNKSRSKGAVVEKPEGGILETAFSDTSGRCSISPNGFQGASTDNHQSNCFLIDAIRLSNSDVTSAADKPHAVKKVISDASKCGYQTNDQLLNTSRSPHQSMNSSTQDCLLVNNESCGAVGMPEMDRGIKAIISIQEDPVVAGSEAKDLASKDFGCENSDRSDSAVGLVPTEVNKSDVGATALPQKKETKVNCGYGLPSSVGGVSYEWPSLTPVYFPSLNSTHLPAATDRLHLDVGYNWHNHLHQSFLSARHQARKTFVEAGFGRMVPSLPLPGSLDWPLSIESSETKTTLDLADDCDMSRWNTEEESGVHAFSGRDYNQFFGGGIMYWNTSDHGATGVSRPPSLSSEDSSWAWHEAELNRTIDDMVGLPPPYNTLASPTSASFCSPFDSLPPAHQSLGYVVSGSDITSKDAMSEDNGSGSVSKTGGGVVEGLTGDSHCYPMLRPIIVSNISRKGSGSEFKLCHDQKSPCIPASRRETPRIKRPPSPVVLCVPRAPAPPPPSPVGESRKQRGFPAVRSGSSSPRNWGMRSWYHDGNYEDAHICVDAPEIIWPSWRNKGLGSSQMIQPLPGTLVQDRLIALSQLALDQEHPDVSLPLHPPDSQSCPSRKVSLSLMHNLLHEEIESFCKQIAVDNLIKKPYITWAVKRVARSLQVLWPRSRINIFGSNATGLALPASDVDLVVRLPPVRNLEPIKEAGILEGRNGIKETCLQHAARYLANQEWVKNDSLKTIENTAIPVIMLVVEVPHDLVTSSGGLSIGKLSNVELDHDISDQTGIPLSNFLSADGGSSLSGTKLNPGRVKDWRSVRLDISFKSPSHTGIQTTELVRELTEQFPAAVPLALVLKQFLADRSLDRSYSGGLSSHCLVLLITRFLQHEHHVCRTNNQNLGSLLMDFLYFFGNVFDPRQMRISIQGSGVYVARERGHSIDPFHIDDPLCPTNNVGRNCFRIHQCIKAFADAYTVLENELESLHPHLDDPSANMKPPFGLLAKIIPSIDQIQEVMAT